MSEETVLFAWRVVENEDGPRIEITESPARQAYHAARRPRGLLARLGDYLPVAAFQHHRGARQHRVREALESLQGIYDDLYERSAGPDAYAQD